MRNPILLALLMTTTLQAADKVVLVIHGGVGVLSEEEMKAEKQTKAQYEAVLAQALAAGYKALQANGPADGVEAAIRVLEDNPLFNAGKGAALTRDGRAELDASMMEGRATGSGEGKKDPRQRAGAVTGLLHVKNPIAAARAVMEMPDGRHSFLAGAGAEDYVLTDDVKVKFHIEKVENAYFWTDRRLKQIRPETREQGALARNRFVGTVGAVALKDGTLVAGTSTGGTSGKLPGRVGDSPVIGAGTYADDRACGVSCTGTGELFLRHAVAHDVTARMRYAKMTVQEAARASISELPDEPGGVGGLIALDPQGQATFALSPLCDGMYRGYVTDKGDMFVAVFTKDAWFKLK